MKWAPHTRSVVRRTGETKCAAPMGSQRLEVGIDLALRVFLLAAVALLQAADEDVLATRDCFEVIVRELGPLRTQLTLRLKPLPGNLIPVHRQLLLWWPAQGCAGNFERCSSRASRRSPQAVSRPNLGHFV